MTNLQILEIHANNTDLNFKNLASISGKTIEELKVIFKDVFVVS
mgnify:CR=1 FL=1